MRVPGLPLTERLKNEAIHTIGQNLTDAAARNLLRSATRSPRTGGSFERAPIQIPALNVRRDCFLGAWICEASTVQMTDGVGWLHGSVVLACKLRYVT